MTMTLPDLPLPAFARVWSDEARAKVVALLERVMSIARNVGADPMLEGGTLLGHLRHDGRLIPWDDDVDLLVDAKAFARWMDAMAGDAELGTVIVGKTRFGPFGKIWWRADAPRPGDARRSPWGWPFIDVFRFADGEQAITYCPGSRSERRWPRAILLPAVPATFEGVAVAIPQHADRILDDLFPNWRIEFDSGAWNHRLERRRWGRKRFLWNPAGVKPARTKAVVYADMCADLFHAGHVNFLRQARALGQWLVVGVHADATIASYKRAPVQSLAERVSAVAGCRHVDQVVPDAPLVVTPRYLDALGARIVCHGDDIGAADTDRMYGLVANTHRFVLIPYTPGISTRSLCERVLARGPDGTTPDAGAGCVVPHRPATGPG